ncbi:hypothetical protein VKT23_000049 [Stygiomarasmius scandens]|uniref:Uncharacterized protein n=1 Tax=Marasmiellus scandens TaxID=2682957 RepID=A0ABR1K301_9AGAR
MASHPSEGTPNVPSTTYLTSQAAENLNAQQIYEVSIGSKLSSVAKKLAGATKEVKDLRTKKEVEAAAEHSGSAASHMAGASSTNKRIMKTYHKLHAKYDVSRAKSHLRNTPPQISNLFDGDQHFSDISFQCPHY